MTPLMVDAATTSDSIKMSCRPASPNRDPVAFINVMTVWNASRRRTILFMKTAFLQCSIWALEYMAWSIATTIVSNCNLLACYAPGQNGEYSYLYSYLLDLCLWLANTLWLSVVELQLVRQVGWNLSIPVWSVLCKQILSHSKQCLPFSGHTVWSCTCTPFHLWNAAAKRLRSFLYSSMVDDHILRRRLECTLTGLLWCCWSNMFLLSLRTRNWLGMPLDYNSCSLSLSVYIESQKPWRWCIWLYKMSPAPLHGLLHVSQKKMHCDKKWWIYE